MYPDDALIWGNNFKFLYQIIMIWCHLSVGCILAFFSICVLFRVDFNLHHRLKFCLKCIVSTKPTFRNIVDYAKSLRQILLFGEGCSNCKLKKFVNDKYIENKINKINKNNYASGVVQKTRNVQQSRIFLFHSQIRLKKCW